jgi:hypothetical protein
MPVRYETVDVFAEKTQLVVMDDKLSASFERGGRMTAQLYVDPASGERMLRAEGKNSQGFIYTADLKRTKDSVPGK